MPRRTVSLPDAEGDNALAESLQQIAAGDADTLLVAKLSAAAGSLGQLVRLLDWLAQADATLVAEDVELDTSTREGQRIVALLREIERWAREPRAERRGRGRPGLSAASPALAQRVAELRERGLSLESIAQTLNAEGVPTARGGERWRPSSVQSALGYRRPRPPLPGAPPPRGPKGGPGPKGKKGDPAKKGGPGKKGPRPPGP